MMLFDNYLSVRDPSLPLQLTSLKGSFDASSLAHSISRAVLFVVIPLRFAQ